MLKKHYLASLIASFILASNVTYASVPTWQITKDKSSLTFSATQNGAPVAGEFKKFSGDIQFDPNQLNASHVQIVVDVDSVTSAYAEVADTLKTADWFDAKRFPHAIFKATHFTAVGKNTYQAEGTLTIRDKTQPVTLHFVLDNCTKTNTQLHGDTTLKRTVFGVGQGDWANTNTIKDEVTVHFSLYATATP
jgi:polyisoprenoid-binding protein YceI